MVHETKNLNKFSRFLNLLKKVRILWMERPRATAPLYRMNGCGMLHNEVKGVADGGNISILRSDRKVILAAF